MNTNFEFKVILRLFHQIGLISCFFICVVFNNTGATPLQGSVYFNTDFEFIQRISNSSDVKEKLQALISKSEEEMTRDLQAALITSQEAFILSESVSDNQIRYEVLNQIARVCFYLDLLEESVEYWVEALEIAQLLENMSYLARTTFNLSALYLSLKDYNKALEYLVTARGYFDQFSESVDYIGNRIQILNNYAIISQHLGNIEEAISSFEEALSLALEHNMQQNLLQVYSAFSNLLALEGFYDRAREMMGSLLELNNRHFQDPTIELSTQIRLAHIESMEGNLLKARDITFALDTAARSIGIPSLQKQILLNLKEYETALGNFREALTYQYRIDSIEKEEKYHNALRLLERKELLLILKRQKEEEHKTHMLNYLLLSALIFIVVWFSVWKFRKHTKDFKSLALNQDKVSQQITSIAVHNQQLKAQLEMSNRDYVTQTIHYLSNKEHLIRAAERAQEKIFDKLGKDKGGMPNIRELIHGQSELLWSDFDLRFNEINKDFYKKLDQDFPNLTINEKRLCAFLKLELTTKEIISLTGQSIRAVEIARTRLRSKLGISHSPESLPQFFRKY